MLYAESTRPDSRGNYIWNVVLMRDLNNPAKTLLIGEHSYFPSWYPDNNQFLYVLEDSGRARVVRSNSTGAGKTFISRTHVGDLDWSPSIKGGVILFSSLINGRWQLVTMRENGSEITILGEGHSPTWHPTQNKILFIRNGDICEMNMDLDHQVTQIYTDMQFRCLTPSYSHDGSRILFAKETEAQAGARGSQYTTGSTARQGTVPNILNRISSQHIFVINADGTNPSPLSSGTASVYSPVWGLNNEIYCVVDDVVSQEIYRIRLVTP
jgi:Tol biopolymer transport system component